MRRRTLAVLAHGARGLGLGVVFAATTVTGVLLHADLAGFRRAAAEIGNRALAPRFEGRVVIGQVESLSIGKKSRVHVRAADVLDPDGKRVVHADDIDATINLRTLLDSLANGIGPAVELEDVRVKTADVVLDRLPDGSTNIGRAFHQPPSKKPAPSVPSAPSTPTSDPYLNISSVRIGHAHVHGSIVPPSLDGEADAIKARVHLEHDVVRIDLDEGTATLLAPHAPNQNEPIKGAVKGALTVAIATQRLSGHADLVGFVGAVPLVAHAQIDGEDVDATVDVARVEVASLGKAFARLPFGRPVEAHARAHGKLPSLAIDARGRVGESDIVATGEIDLREGHAFKLDADAKHVDASAYGSPVATDITTKVHAEGVVGGLGLGVLGTYKVTTEAGTVATEPVPAATIEGKLEENRITATVRATETGVDLSGTGDLDLGSLVTTFDLQARTTSVRKIARAARTGIDGSASVRAQGKLDLRSLTIAASTTLHGDGLALDLFSAAHLDANGLLHGPIAAPTLDVGFSGKELAVKAKDKKPLLYPSATGRARIAFVPNVSIVSLNVDFGEKGSKDAIGASAASISIKDGVVDVRGVSLTGLGEPLELDVSAGEGGYRIRAKSDGVDLRRVAAMTGIQELKVLPEGTKARLDVDVQDAYGGANGHIDVTVTSEKGALLGGGVKLETHAVIEHGHLVGNAKVSSEGLGWVEIQKAELDIPGHLDARSVQRTTGVVELRGSFDLAQGGALFGGDHIESMAGIASFEGRIERGDPDALPAVRATVKTNGLAVVYSEDPSKPSIKGEGIDLSAHLEWDGRTEDGELSIVSWDRHGILGSAAATSKVSLLAWATGAKRLDRRTAENLEISAIFDVPSREVSNLPAFLGLPALLGRVGGRVSFSSSVAHPSVVVSARADGLRAPPTRARTGAAPGATSFEPLDGVVEAHWDGEQGAVSFALDEREPRRPRGAPPAMLAGIDPALPAGQRRAKRAPGHLHGLVLLTDLRMGDLFHGRPPNALPWSAATEIEVANLNLGALPIPLAVGTGRGTGLSGALSGRIRIRDLNRDASIQAQATVTDFGLGGAAVEGLDLTVFGRDASVFAHAKLNDKESSATFQLSTQGVRIDGLDVSWNGAGTSRLDYAVQNASLALIAPIVRRQISEIDGRVNGTGSVALDGESQVFEGGLALSGTNMYVNTLGEEITNLTATARFDRSGTFRIDDASGKLGNGEFHAKANGRMKGFAFEEAAAQITAAKEGVPISSEGASFASASGEVNVIAKMSQDRSALEVTLQVPRAEIELPDRSTQQLESLDPDPTIAIGLRKKDGKLDTTAVRRGRGGTGRTTAATTSTFLTKIDATLGDKVHLEGRGLDVILGGHTYVQLANELSVTGQIDLRGGTIEVHGRRFSVDRGVVSFSEGGNPANPNVVAAAYWDAPDRTRVWVEFAGPLKTGTLTLRSEPAYSKNEILSILLFGQPDPNMATGGGAADKKGDAAGATAIGTGFVASDVNRMLSEIDENLDIETDTLSGNRARTKLGRTFFDRRLKVQIGVAPGYTYREPDTTFLFLNWQFIPKWAIVATRGDKGTSILDVLFQHRY